MPKGPLSVAAGGALTRPPRTDEWEIVAADKGVADAWAPLGGSGTELAGCRTPPVVEGPDGLLPPAEETGGRDLGAGAFEGQTFARWQYEVTAGGRIFYFVDDPTDGGRRNPQRQSRGPRPRRRVIVEAVHPGHPKGTERKNR